MCREMKDSGVQWIGEIPKEKSIINIKYLLSYVKGKNPNEINESGKGKPYIGASDLDKDRRYLEYKNYCDEELPYAEKEDVLVLWDGARAGLIGTNHEGYISSTIVKILPNVKYIKRRFFYWHLRGAEKYLFEQVRGTTIPHMSREFIDNMGMISFSFNEQQQIANYLDKKVSQIDDIISKQKSLIEKYKAYRQSLITETVTKGLSKNVPMKDSGVEWIGKIPKNWNKKKISRCFQSIGSGTTPTSNNELYYNGEINWLQTGDLNDGVIVNTNKKITKLALNDYSTLKEFSVGSLVIAMYGATIGKLGILDIPTTVNQACCVLSNPIGTDTLYMFYWFLANRSEIVRLSQGAGQPNISQGIIKELYIFMPPLDEQLQIANFLDKKCKSTDSAIAKKEQLIEKLEAYKRSLIYECVTGKREVN